MESHLPKGYRQGIIGASAQSACRQTKRPANRSWPRRAFKSVSGGPANGLDAFGAKILAHFATFIKDGHTLNIRPELASGSDIRVTYISTETGPFSATIALGHCSNPQELSPCGEDCKSKATQMRSPQEKFTTRVA
jgi:hypothetical protein